ncbi:MAG: hypothetical protein ACI4JK_11725 [Oscillospiraceae bacterium]
MTLVLYKNMEFKIKINNNEIGEKACAFARNMNGVDCAELDSGEITVTLSSNGSENVVRGAVESYIEAIGGGVGGIDPEKAKSQLKNVLSILTAVILAVIGAVLEHKGIETTPLFIFIAAYIIAGWDIIFSLIEKVKEKLLPNILEAFGCIISLALFIFGLYLPAIALIIVFKLASMMKKE